MPTTGTYGAGFYGYGTYGDLDGDTIRYFDSSLTSGEHDGTATASHHEGDGP